MKYVAQAILLSLSVLTLSTHASEPNWSKFQANFYFTCSVHQLLTQPNCMTQRISAFSAVQRVKVKVLNTRGDQLLALLNRKMRCDEAACFLIILNPCKSRRQTRRHVRTTGLCKTQDAPDVFRNHNAGNNWHRDALKNY